MNACKNYCKLLGSIGINENIGTEWIKSQTLEVLSGDFENKMTLTISLATNKNK